MAMEQWTANELEAFAKSIQKAAEKIQAVCVRMREEDFPHIVMEASCAVAVYGPSICKMAACIDTEFDDQVSAKRLGRLARWESNRVRVSRRTAKRNQCSMESETV